MAGENWTFGIESVLSGEPGTNGTMGTSLTEHGETLKGTATLETSDETINWIETEEKGKRIPIPQNDAETTLTLEVANPSMETMAYYLGGEVKTTGTEPNIKKSYSPPRNKSLIYKSFRIVTKEGYNIEIPYGNVVATPLGGNITTDNVLTLKVVVNVQLPEDSDTEALTYVEK